MEKAFQYIDQALSLLPSLIQAGRDVTQLINNARAVAQARQDPTSDQWNVLDSLVREQHNRIQS